MRRYIKIFAITVILCMVCTRLPIKDRNSALAATGGIYYIDSLGGNDDNQGTALNKPWKSLDKVNAMVFKPGDKILFKAGGIWSGVFTPKGSGTAENPIIIDQYGVGAKPAFIGMEDKDCTLSIYNIQYIEINNLDISANYKNSLERRGVHIAATDFGTVNHIYLKNLDIHDVKPNLKYVDSNSFKTTGGIFIEITGTTTLTNYNDLKIEGCSIRNVDRTGIQFIISSWTNRGGANMGTGRWYPSTNVVIRNNVLQDIGGDGIVVQGSQGALVEYNVVNGFATRNQVITYNAGIWSHKSDDTVFQYNEAYNGKTTMDGMAWDSDGLSNRTIFQYNYSHDNEGGCALFISYKTAEGVVHPSIDSIFRYNISQNDRYALITGNSPQSGEVYNNVFYVGPGMDVKAFKRTDGKLSFKNNIFYVAEGGTLKGNWSGEKGTKYSYDHNMYYGNITKLPADANGIIEDPKFVNPGSGVIGRDSVDGYKLQSDSPAINSGVFIKNNGGKDYFGNPIYKGAPDMGAFEYQDESALENPEENPEIGTARAELFSDIQSAESELSAAVVGFELGQYPLGAYNSFKKAIELGNELANYKYVSLEQLEQAIERIKDSTVKFEYFKINKDTGDIDGVTGVNEGDVAVVSKYLGSDATKGNWTEAKIADVTGDDAVDLQDKALVLRQMKYFY